MAFRIAIAAMWLVATPAFAQHSYMRAHFVNVGQGDAALLEFPCGVVLIDAGGQNDATTQRLLDYLDQVFQRRTDLQRGHARGIIDSIIVTHNHVDHTRALREVVERFQVDRFVENGQRGGWPPGDADVVWLNDNRATGGRSVRIFDVDDSHIRSRRGYTNQAIAPIRCPSIDPEIRVLSADLEANPGWPRGDFRNKNSHSIVVRIDFGRSSFLFTGDLETHAIETLVDYYDGTDALDVDVWQVGHHGSYNGTTRSFIQAASPRVAVISMSRWTDRRGHTAWQYGHPREDAIRELRAGIQRMRRPRYVHVADGVRDFHRSRMRHAIFGTGWDGTVVVHARSDGRLVVRRSRR